MPTRRFFLGGVLGLPFVDAARAASRDAPRLREHFADIEAGTGGRLGVAVLGAGGEVLADWRGGERFPMCSTFKALLVGAILARVDAGAEDLGRAVAIAPRDILDYAPVTKGHAGGSLSVAALCEAAITVSDNTAANLLLNALGGPPALTHFARELGDEVTWLDRFEPDLNEAIPGDPRDTTTPLAMAKTLAKVALGNALRPDSRERLTGWMVDCRTGAAKLRAGLPDGWRVGDKTGSGERGSSNDVAIVWPPGRAPLVIASYLTECAAADAVKNAAHADVARTVVGMMGG